MNDELHPDGIASPGVTPAASPVDELAARRGPDAWQVPGRSLHGSAPDASGRGGRLLPIVVAASLLSAIIASGGTAAIVLMAGGSTAATSPAASTASTAGQASTTTVTLDSSDAVVAVAASASPAVVTITSQTTAQGFGPFSVPATGVGSGFIIDADGLILTNYHVIDGAQDLVVTLEDGRELAATVVAADQTHDLAVVKVDATGLPTIELGSSADLQVGQLVVAIGSPLGTYTDTVTSGILSGTGRTITVASATSRRGQTLTDLLQTDAAINEGNSGGPLLDATGHAIGINTAVDSTAQGIGFAVPIDTAASVIAEARAANAANT